MTGLTDDWPVRTSSESYSAHSLESCLLNAGPVLKNTIVLKWPLISRGIKRNERLMVKLVVQKDNILAFYETLSTQQKIKFFITIKKSLIVASTKVKVYHCSYCGPIGRAVTFY